MRYKKPKTPAAGIVVVRRFPEGWRVLGLRLGGEYDLPKGKIDPGESLFDCAIRETHEESGLSFNDLLFTWGNIDKKIKHIMFFLAETNADPRVLTNPETGIREHDSADWLRWDDIKNTCYPYLEEVICWAEKIVERE